MKSKKILLAVAAAVIVFLILYAIFQLLAAYSITQWRPAF